MKTLLKDHRGTKIYVTELGHFEADIQIGGYRGAPKRVSRKDLRAVEREIEQALPVGTSWPGLDVFSINEYHTDPTRVIRRFRLAGLRVKKNGRREEITMLDETGTDVHYGSQYAWDETAANRIAEIVVETAKLEAEKKAIITSLGGGVQSWTVKRMIDEWDKAHDARPTEVEVAD